jgi:hypothetical protein
MKKLITITLLFTALISYSQKDIGTEVVNVVKLYTPTISDAFKVKETPTVEEEETAKKEIVKYNIFSFPVASTFAPAKGKAADVEKEKQEELFKNYATLGIGNYGTAVAELFVTENFSETAYFGAMLRHLSSQGGIKNVELSDKFYNTSLDLSYRENLKNSAYNIDAGFQNQIYNYYGLPTDFGSSLSAINRFKKINAIDSKQAFNDFYLAGNLSVKESIFKEMSIKFEHFTDDLSSVENRFYIKPTLEFEMFDTKIKTNIIADYLGGSFDKNYYYTNTETIKYGFTILGINPNIVFNKADWTLNVGANLFYFSDTVNKTSKFLIYPQISASIKVVNDFMIFYAGAEGGIVQNSYKDFTNTNPYLSPTFEVRPTDKQFDVFAGLKGKVSTTVSYNVRGSLVNEKYKPLFQANDYFLYNSNSNGYAIGNSFQVIFDDVKTLNFFGELKGDFSKYVSFGINGNFSTFVMNKEDKAWNLPAIKLGANLDFDITEKWYAGTNIFYVSERYDRQIDANLVWIVAPDPNIFNKKIAGYFDVNANLGFKYSSKLTTFLRANNIANQQYTKWLNYPVQGFQVVLGASYKF